MNNFTKCKVFLAVAAISIGGACQSGGSNSATGNSNNTNAFVITNPATENKNALSSNDSTAANSNANSATTSNVNVLLGTPSDTFRSHYAALAANDEAALRKTLSAGMLKFYAAMFPGEKISEIMREILKKQGQATTTPEIVSEKITGEMAILKWRAADGTIVDQPLVKEGGDWKMSMGK